MKLLGIAGSLREGSYNRGLLRAARELLPEDVELVEFDIRGLPFYDGDVEAAGDPEAVVALKEAIREADALLIATPEYNRGVPGGLKNAIDWASRPPTGSALHDKPAAIMGASPGGFGTTRAQHQLRQVFCFTRTLPLAHPEVQIARATEKFDGSGRLTDEKTREFVRSLLVALQAWTERLGRG
jgi:chromate reductase